MIEPRTVKLLVAACGLGLAALAVTGQGAVAAAVVLTPKTGEYIALLRACCPPFAPAPIVKVSAPVKLEELDLGEQIDWARDIVFDPGAANDRMLMHAYDVDVLVESVIAEILRQSWDQDVRVAFVVEAAPIWEKIVEEGLSTSGLVMFEESTYVGVPFIAKPALFGGPITTNVVKGLVADALEASFGRRFGTERILSLDKVYLATSEPLPDVETTKEFITEKSAWPIEQELLEQLMRKGLVD